MALKIKSGEGTRYSREKSLGRKVLDGVKYIGNKSLNIVPFVASHRYNKKQKSLKINERDGFIKESMKDVMYAIYNIGTTGTLCVYLFAAGLSEIWTLKQYKEYKKEIKSQDALWDKQNPFQDCKTKTDSINKLYDLGYENKIKIWSFSRNERKRILDDLVEE